MKKLILLIITMVLATVAANGISVKNKGSTLTVNNNSLTTAIITDLTVETPADSWVQPQNSSTKPVIDRGSMMNNSQNLMWKKYIPKSTQNSLFAKLTMLPISGLHFLTIETSVEVQKIPNIVMIMNSFNTQRPNNNMVQWRQTSIDMMMTNTNGPEMFNGANVCAVKKANFYNSFGNDNSRQDAG